MLHQVEQRWNGYSPRRTGSFGVVPLLHLRDPYDVNLSTRTFPCVRGVTMEQLPEVRFLTGVFGVPSLVTSGGTDGTDCGAVPGAERPTPQASIAPTCCYFITPRTGRQAGSCPASFLFRRTVLIPVSGLGSSRPRHAVPLGPSSPVFGCSRSVVR